IPKRGYRFVAAVREVEEPETVALVTPQPARTVAPAASRKRVLWSLLLALSATLAVFGILVARRLWPTENAPPQRVMLAVLAFENLSGDPGEDYLADGLTEEMIAQLGQLQPAKLGVIARTSTVRYKHTKQSIAQIGRELGVGYLLEGSVRRGGDRVRV